MKITAPKNIADLAQEFHDSAISFWRLSRDEPKASREKWQRNRAEVKASVQRFRAALRSEFGDSMGEDLGRLDYE